jgi:protein-L-isoaspartate(D-aspartate) O-methyltransferase
MEQNEIMIGVMERGIRRLLAAVAILGFGLCFARQDEAWFARKRRDMVELQLKARDIKDKKVLEIMGTVPRHLFVDPAVRTDAYEDYPLPIAEGQTISQPYIVALMTQSLELKGREKVLEVGTGSGYQAAVLARLTKNVYSIEIHEGLAAKAADLLRRLGNANVEIRSGDGYFGWPEQAPFDAIVVTCAAGKLPEPLFEELKEGGRLVIPVGETDGVQTLIRIRKINGQKRIEEITAVRFVPMTGENQKIKKLGD